MKFQDLAPKWDNTLFNILHDRKSDYNIPLANSYNRYNSVIYEACGHALNNRGKEGVFGCDECTKLDNESADTIMGFTGYYVHTNFKEQITKFYDKVVPKIEQHFRETHSN